MTNPTPAELDALAREYVDLKAARTLADERMKVIDETFRTAFEYGPHLAGNAKVQITRNVRRDDVAFQAAYPFEDFPDYYKPSVDTATIKRELAPAVLERFEIVGAPKVIVTPLAD